MDRSFFNVSTAGIVSSVMTILAPKLSSFGSFVCTIEDESNDNATPGTRGMNADNRLDIDFALLPTTL